MVDSFQPVFADLVRNFTTTAGTGNFELGAAMTGYRGFETAVKPGDSFYYSVLGIEQADEFEVGRGTMQPDGTISRDPIGSALTDFSEGNKSIALVAAAEWFDGVQADSAASFLSAPSREALAALGDRSRPAMLYEARREGLFDFDPSDRSAEVGYDPQQAIYVAPATDPSGASGAWVRRHSKVVEAGWFGAVGDGVTDDYPAFQAALTYFESTGGGELHLGNADYATSYVLLLFAPDVTIDARGATITTADEDSTPMLFVGGNGTRILGGTWKVANPQARQFDVQGRDCHLDGCKLLHEPEAGSPHMYVRHGADGFQMRNCHLSGTHEGVVVEASDVLIAFNAFESASVGSDDSIAIKAISGVTENIRIIGNRFRRHYNVVGIGSQIGMAKADDPAHTRRVRNVVVVGNTVEECTTLVYIKPGAVAVDYRDGVVEDVVISDNILLDLEGTHFGRGVVVEAGRGAIVRNIKGSNNLIKARAYSDTSTGPKAGALYIGTPNVGGNPATIEDVDVEITFFDPYDGAPFGTAGVPGHPLANVVLIEKDSPGSVTMRGIRLRIKGNGSRSAGLSVAAGLDDAVTIDRLELSNVSSGTLGGGIRSDSRIKVLNFADLRVTALGGKTYNMAGNGSLDGPGFVLAQSAVAVSHTGNTNETDLATVTVPGGLLGRNGRVEIEALWSGTGAGKKAYKVRIGNKLLHGIAVTNNAYRHSITIANRNDVASQIAAPTNIDGGWGTSGDALVTASNNTFDDLLFRFQAAVFDAADTQTLESYCVRVFPKG